MGGEDTSANNFGYTGTDYSKIPISGVGEYSYFDFPMDWRPTPEKQSNFDGYNYGTEQLDNATRDIEHIRLQIKGQKPGTMSALADWWLKVQQLFAEVKRVVAENGDNLHGGSDKGFGGWTSPAATEFLRWGPGATLYSIGKWAEAAKNNEDALRKLVGDVLWAHDQIDKAWLAYVAEAAQVKQEVVGDFAIDPTTMSKEQLKNAGGPANQAVNTLYIRETTLWRKWSHTAQGIVHELGQRYMVQLQGPLISGRSTQFEGPSNAVVSPVGMPSIGGPPSVGHPPPNLPPDQHAKLLAQLKTTGSPEQMFQQLIEQANKGIQNSIPTPPSITDPSGLAHPGPGAPPPLMMSPSVASMLGLSPFGMGGPRGFAWSPKGLVRTGLATPGAGNVGAPGSGMLGREGVLRSSASMPTDGGMRSPTMPPPTRPGGKLKPAQPHPPGTLGKSSSTGHPADPHPFSGKRGGGRQQDAPVPPATQQSPFGGVPGARPPGTAPPVLGGKSTAARAPGGPQQGWDTGPTRPANPSAAPPVLKGTAKSNKDTTNATALPGGTAPPTQPGATSPVLRAAQRPTGAAGESLGEVPSALRGGQVGAGSSHASGAVPSELASRRHLRPDQTRVDQSGADAQGHQGTEQDTGPRVIRDEEAWTVQTPGGGVLGSRGEEQQPYQAEPKPTLGGGASS